MPLVPHFWELRAFLWRIGVDLVVAELVKLMEEAVMFGFWAIGIVLNYSKSCQVIHKVLEWDTRVAFLIDGPWKVIKVWNVLLHGLHASSNHFLIFQIVLYALGHVAAEQEFAINSLLRCSRSIISHHHISLAVLGLVIFVLITVIRLDD